MRIRRLLVLVLTMWVSRGAVALAQEDRPQDYRVARWTTAEGLPQNTINDIVALPNGELWLATFGGLVRFDGTDFRVVDIAGDEDLASNRVTALALAGTDAFWFVTQEGHLGRIEGGQGTRRDRRRQIHARRDRFARRPWAVLRPDPGWRRLDE